MSNIRNINDELNARNTRQTGEAAIAAMDDYLIELRNRADPHGLNDWMARAIDAFFTNFHTNSIKDEVSYPIDYRERTLDDDLPFRQWAFDLESTSKTQEDKRVVICTLDQISSFSVPQTTVDDELAAFGQHVDAFVTSLNDSPYTVFAGIAVNQFGLAILNIFTALPEVTHASFFDRGIAGGNLRLVGPAVKDKRLCLTVEYNLQLPLDFIEHEMKHIDITDPRLNKYPDPTEEG